MKNKKTKFLNIDTTEGISKNEKEKIWLPPLRNAKTTPRKSFDNISAMKNNIKILGINVPANKFLVSVCSPIEIKLNQEKGPSVLNTAYALHKGIIGIVKSTKTVSIQLANKDRAQSSDHNGNLSEHNSPNFMKKLKPESSLNCKKVVSLFSPLQNTKKQLSKFNYINIGQTNEIKPNNSTILTLKQFFNPSAKSVKEYSYREDANMSCRDYMEDYCKIVDKFKEDNTKGLFCLFDGHGGSHSVTYVKERLPQVFSKFLKDTNNTVEKALVFTFQKIDDELKLFSESQNGGTTACVVYFHREQDIAVGSKRMLYCANVGDTRAILITTKEAKRLSYDHKCTDTTEADRIRKIGGIIFNARIFGQLALSRALGDHALKKYGVTPNPCINKHIISEKDRYVVMCSDGVWDVLTNQDIFELSANSANADELSKIIIAEAIERGSQDNISCIAIKIN